MTPLWVLAAAIVVGLEWAQHTKGGNHAAQRKLRGQEVTPDEEVTAGQEGGTGQENVVPDEEAVTQKPPGPDYV